VRRAVGIVRVSQSRGREGESFISPGDQRQRIVDTCRRLDLQLASAPEDIPEEIDVSGGKPLDARPGLLTGIEAIEAKQAEVLIVGYLDRLVRSIAVQHEIVSRVEAAGGEVLAVDYGKVSQETAVQWLSGSMVGLVHEYYRRQATERAAAAQANAVARGVCPFPRVPPGLALDNDGRPFTTGDAPTALGAFELRDEGKTIKEIRTFLKERGIERSFHGVSTMLENRLYLGEIHFGKLVNLKAFDPVVPRPLFNRVQRIKAPRGRRAKSDRLLARQGILRHDLCGSRMNVGTQTQNGRKYPFYRCPTTGDCPKRVTIGAEIVEGLVIAAVKERLANEEGRASAAQDARRAAAMREKTQADLAAAIRAFTGLEDEEAARERLEELRQARDEAEERWGQLRGASAGLTVTVADWDRLTLAEKRGLVRATVESVAISNEGRGAERVTIHLFGE